MYVHACMYYTHVYVYQLIRLLRYQAYTKYSTYKAYQLTLLIDVVCISGHFFWCTYVCVNSCVISGAAKALFSNLHLFGWAFDIELIYMAERLHIPIVEMPVTWKEVDGSKLIRNKLDIITTSLTMARDIVCVWVAYNSGVWTFTQPRKALVAAAGGDEL